MGGTDHVIRKFLDRLTEVMMAFVKIITYYAPIAFFALFADLVATYGSSVASAYGRAMVVYLSLIHILTAEDTVLFLLSGGGSAVFEAPLVPQEELQSITQSLLASGADIVEMNTIRKRLSAVKGGRFAQHCAPARVFSIVLSDIIGDPLDMIASGPAYPDSSTCLLYTSRCV